MNYLEKSPNGIFRPKIGNFIQFLTKKVRSLKKKRLHPHLFSGQKCAF